MRVVLARWCQILLHFLCVGVITAMVTLTAQAQSGSTPQITQSVVAGGGGTSSSGNRKVEGTTGQSATRTSDGGTYSMTSGFWSADAQSVTTVVVPNVTGTYGGTVSLSATLSSKATNLGDKTITFALNETDVGTAITDTSGLATLVNVSLVGINVGTYPGVITARFDSDPTFAASSASSRLTVSQATPLLQVTGGSFTYDGLPHPALVVVTGVSGELLSPLSILYNGSSSAPVNAGTYVITASFAGNQNYSSALNNLQSIIINKASQTITFNSISNKTFGDASFLLSAAGGASSNPVLFSSQTLAVCSVSTNTVNILSVGPCTIRASQAGDANHSAASDVDQTFSIAKATTTTLLSASTSTAMLGQPISFTVNVNSTAGQPNGSVTFKVDGNSIATCANVNLNLGQANCSINSLAVGSHTVSAEYAGDTNFNSSSASPTNIEILSVAGFEFSQAVYSVVERGGSVVITVRRTGETSGAATVDYATDDGRDPSIEVPCATVTGSSLERCDYARAEGTLRFAAGETEKTFTVLVNDDSYVEGLETISLKLSNPIGSALASQSTATLQITDDLVESTINPLDNAAGFVRQHYHDFLNREPDVEGLQFWTSNITSCGTDTLCIAQKRVDTSAAFFLSIEFQQTGFLVERFYKTAYGDLTAVVNSPNPRDVTVPIVRLREFFRDTQEMSQGVVVLQNGWEQKLELNKTVFARDFVSRARFANAFPSSMTAQQFVAQLNVNAGGVLSGSEISELENIFGGGSASAADTTKRAQVLRLIAENPRLQQQEMNRAFVLMQYFGYLRRNLNDAPDTDYSGYDFWLQKLEQFGGDFRSAEMVQAFINSIEYRQRFFHSPGGN